MFDFGRETMGYIVFNDVKKGEEIEIYYGESSEEALDHDYCETLDFLTVPSDGVFIVPDSKAFRYVHVVCCTRTLYDVSGLY
ncbi:hypothetical protein, partial [Klebsiella pneumoniae]|uniref:hypothetical protein n=1 Tax=Klebsiella pneumoniae TaxID=573 RepID=UPI00338F500B